MATQSVNIKIQAQVNDALTGLNAVARQVEKLEKDMEALRRVQNSAGGSTNKFKSHLDEVSKAARRNRQGVQQAGMQINDFATSISSGTSPVQAFNQQIGQLGYAMSMMQGRAAKIGNFLAGPWSVLVLGASMVLAPFIEKLFESKNALEEVEMAGDALGEAQGTLSQVMDLTTMSFNTQSQAARDLAEAQLILARAEATRNRAAAQRGLEDYSAGSIFDTLDGLRAAGLDAGNYLEPMVQQFLNGEKSASEMLQTLQRFESYIPDEQFDQLVTAVASLGAEAENIETIDSALNVLRGTASGVESALFRVTKETTKQTSETDILRGRMNGLIADYEAGRISLLDYTAQARELLRLYDEIKAEKGPEKRLLEDVENAFPALEELRRQFAPLIAENRKLIDEGLRVEIKPGDTFDQSARQILDFYAQWNSAQEAVGMAVSDAFQGMLTGAMSWKDGMKSIIQSVIAELWKLFVVQQIVGFVKGLIPGATDVGGGVSGISSPSGIGYAFGGGMAKGGYVSQGTPYMVGERGPEMFVPGASGTIIPNHNMGRSGGGTNVTVNVDARGATDPAMVREQAQRAVLEAAPAIISASQQGTMTTLGRPRLGGVIR